MIGKLKKIIEKEGIVRVSSDLGYRSPGTIKSWIYNKKVPNLAKEKVKNYLTKKEASK